MLENGTQRSYSNERSAYKFGAYERKQRNSERMRKFCWSKRALAN